MNTHCGHHFFWYSEALALQLVGKPVTKAVFYHAWSYIMTGNKLNTVQHNTFSILLCIKYALYWKTKDATCYKKRREIPPLCVRLVAFLM